MLFFAERTAGDLGFDLLARHSGFAIKKLQLQIGQLLALLAVLLDALQTKRLLQLLNDRLCRGKRLPAARKLSILVGKSMLLRLHILPQLLHDRRNNRVERCRQSEFRGGIHL